MSFSSVHSAIAGSLRSNIFPIQQEHSAPTRVGRVASSIIDQTQALLDCLASKFECPILSQRVLPAEDSEQAQINNRGYRKLKSDFLRAQPNKWMAPDYVAPINANSFQHVFIVDEDALASRVGRAASGRFIYSSEWQHATVLSEKLSELYQDKIAAVANLVGKKLVICDLDNTLWDGVIGEGDVSHFLERRSLLRH